MVVKVWHLALPLLVLAVACSFYIGRSSAHPTATISPEVLAEKETTIATLRAQLAAVQGGQERSAAQSDVRAVIPDIESYNADNTVGNTTTDPDAAIDTTHSDSGYQGMTASLLRSSYDQQFPAEVWIIGSNDIAGTMPPTGTLITANGALSTTNYCVVAQNGSWYAWKHGPGGLISVSTDKNLICG